MKNLNMQLKEQESSKSEICFDSRLGKTLPDSPPMFYQQEEEDSENNSLASSRLGSHIPEDHGRWKSTKAAEHARHLQTIHSLLHESSSGIT